jgi:RNA polymerase sigma-70 factor (ECF subfamily)
MMSSMADSSPEQHGFPPTAWTLVRQAAVSEEDVRARALNEIAQRYWEPIYVYLRKSGRSAADAEDLTQAFFIHLLEKELLSRVQVRQVRFRAFLRSVLENFLANHARTASAKKRSAGPLFDIHEAEERLTRVVAVSPADAFESVCALARIEAAIVTLRSELRPASREWIVDALLERFRFPTAGGESSVTELSARHGVTENQLSVAMHRARKQLRQILLADFSRSTDSPEEAAEELAAMFAALAKSTQE